MVTLMVLYSRATERHSVSAGWHLQNKCSLQFIRPTGRGEFIFKELPLEGVDDTFW